MPWQQKRVHIKVLIKKPEVGSSKQGYIDELQMFDKSLKVAFFLGNVQGMTLLKDRIDTLPTWTKIQKVRLKPKNKKKWQGRKTKNPKKKHKK